MILVFCVVLIATTESAGTLYLTLERYANDTCGGFVLETGGCTYHVSLLVTSHYTRVKRAVVIQKHYTLHALVARNNYLRFPQGRHALGRGISNPLPVVTSEGDVNVTFSVRNTIGQSIFVRDYHIQTDTVLPGQRSRITDNLLVRGGFVQILARLECDENFVGVGCGRCKQGWHGRRCNVYCVQAAAFSCHNVSGEKVCGAGYYGAHCSRHCQGTVNYTCTQHGNRLCIYPAVGPTCTATTQCPEYMHGEGCSNHCKPQPGKYLCGEQGEMVCEGPFAGPNCTACLLPYYGTSCNTTCTPASGRYTCSHSGYMECSGTWAGGECDTCAEHYSGADCEVLCNPTSHRYTCNKYGVKVCRSSWSGQECEACRDHYYGHNCEVYCQDTTLWSCDPGTGSIICLGHRTGDNCSECAEGYTAHTVTDQHVTCVQCVETHCSIRGEKVCNSGWYGPDCEDNCTATARYYCRRTPTGYLLDCRDNYSGRYCEVCAWSYYGPACSVQCFTGPNKTCHEDGTFTCSANNYGPYCDVFCDASSTKYTCSGLGERDCIGQRDPGTGCETCVPGYYTDTCNVECRAGATELCTEEGVLTCRSRWTGERCEECAEGWFGEECAVKCHDTLAYSCNTQGILEMNRTEHDIKTHLFYLSLLIGGTVIFNAVAIYVVCKAVPRVVSSTSAFTAVPLLEKQGAHITL